MLTFAGYDSRYGSERLMSIATALDSLTSDVTAGFPAETYLGSRMREGGLFER